MQEEQVGLLIASARRRIKQTVLARTAVHRLPPQQFWFLVNLRERPGISQVELAERVRSDAPTVSRAVFGLTRRGLVRGAPDPADRRRMQLFLTPAGQRLAKELAAVAAEIRAAITDGMTRSELAALRDGLRHVISNLDQLEAARASRRPQAAGRRAIR
jgi:DNA-binding MarR family transcriptional regulator